VLAYLDPASGPSAATIVGVGLVIFVIYFAICWWIARYAERKGQSFIGFLLLGVLVSPIISLIVALVIDDRAPRPGGDRLDRLQKLTELREAGSLSPEEFEAEKARILAEPT
jgi:uncharacterized membrane protein YedE/YeeE